MGRKTSIVALYSLWVFAAFMGVQYAVGGIFSLLKLVGVSFSTMNEAVFSSVVGIIVYSATLCVAIGVPWLVLKRKTTKEEVGLQRSVAWKDYGWLGLGFVSYLILTMVVTSLAMIFLKFIDFGEAQTTGYESVASTYEYVLAFIGLVIVAPVAEELLFRGYLFGKLRSAGIKTWVSVLVTSLLFAVAHFQGNVGVDVFALGIVLALLRVFSGSLWPSIMLHMLKNGIAYYFLFINPTFLSTLGG